jgi:hypothetical protein
MTSKTDVLDVFQPGLNRGSERLAFDPEKRYAYVEHAGEGWRVYLRSAAFIYILGKNKKYNPKKFVIVKTVGVNTWEMPKGQMEGKDINLRDSIMSLLYRNVKREIFEESGLKGIKDLKYTGLAFQGQEKTYNKDTYFHYHIFRGFVTEKQFEKAKKRFEWFSENKEHFDKLTRDKKEKDDIKLYEEGVPIRGRWGPKIIDLYMASPLSKHIGQTKTVSKSTRKTRTSKRKRKTRRAGGGCGCSAGSSLGPLFT